MARTSMRVAASSASAVGRASTSIFRRPCSSACRSNARNAARLASDAGSRTGAGMFGIADYGAFIVAVIVFLMIPGPGNLALVTSTSKGRIAGGLAATLGVIAGDQVLIWLAVAGVAALLS